MSPLFRASVATASLALASSAFAQGVRFEKSPAWEKVVFDDIRVAPRTQVQRVMAKEAFARFGAKADIHITLSPPHGFTAGISKNASIARVFGTVNVNGKPAGEIFVDASHGRVNVYQGQDQLLRQHGLPDTDQQLANYKKAHPEKLQPMRFPVQFGWFPFGR